MTLHVIPKKSNLIRNTLIMFSLMFLMQAIFIGTVATMVAQTRAEVMKQRETRRMLSLIGRVTRNVKEVAKMTSLQSIERSDAAEERFEDTVTRMNTNVEILRSSLEDRDVFKEWIQDIDNNCKLLREICIQHLKPAGVTTFNFLGTRVSRPTHETDFYRMTTTSTEILERLAELQEPFLQVEKDAQEHLSFQSSLLFNASLWLGLVATIAGAFFLYYLFSSKVIARLAKINKDLLDMAAGKTLEPLPAYVDEGDEIGQLALQLRQMERTLQNMRSKERTLLENSASCICSIDAKASFISVNQASKALWGASPDELIGTPILDLIESQDVDTTSEKLRQLFLDGQSVTFENRLKHKDGRIIDLAWKATLAPEHNIAVCVAQDVTTRNTILRRIRRSEEEFRGMVDSMPVAVITCDDSNTIASVNPATQNMLEYAPQDLLGRKLELLLTGKRELLSPDQIEEILTAAEKHPIDMRIAKSDGKRIPVEFSTRRYSLEDDRGLLATFKDVSARFEIETVKKEFVAMISHDLRSPLTAIHGTFEVITMDSDSGGKSNDAEALDLVHKAQNIVYGLVNVLNDFLDLEKFEAGLFALESQQLTLRTLLAELQNHLMGKCCSEELEFESKEEWLDTTISVDLARMVYALSTIVLISAQFRIEDSDGDIEAITVTVSPSENGLELKLNSCRLTDEIKQAIDSPYKFISDARLHGTIPSGLSLSLSRAIFNAHRATMRVEQRGGFDRIVVTLRK